MGKSYYNFEFNEANFQQQKDVISNLINNNAGKNICFAKELPLCIYPEKQNIIDGEIVLSDKNILINHNMLYGVKYQAINKKLARSPYLSRDCKNCGSFKNFSCRGLLNSEFLKVRDKIIAKRSLIEYNAIKHEFENGILALSSSCDFNCKFCCKSQKYTPELIHIKNQLKIPEIKHFIHYLTDLELLYDIMHMKCSPGDTMFSGNKNLLDILKLVQLFTNTFTITTGVFDLSEEIVDFLSGNNKFKLNMSLHTIDDQLRKSLMNSTKESNILESLNKIINSDINFALQIVPLKETIESGDLKKTIEFLSSKNLKPLMLDNFYHDKMTQEIKENLTYGNKKLKQYLQENNLYDKVFMQFEVYFDFFPSFLKKLNNFVHSIPSDQRILLLSPISSYSKIKTEISKFDNVSIELVRSSPMRLKPEISALLTIDDYTKVLSQYNNDYDILVVAMNSFNDKFEDINTENLNQLASKIDMSEKQIYLF